MSIWSINKEKKGTRGMLQRVEIAPEEGRALDFLSRMHGKKKGVRDAPSQIQGEGRPRQNILFLFRKDP